MRTNLQKYRLLSNFLPNSNKRRLVLITGARQTGKTTLAKKYYNSLNYFNFDSSEIRLQAKEISSFSWGKSVGRAILDEAQKEPEIFEKIKYAYDKGDIDFSVILGSSQILLLKKIRESLAGRIFIYELWPLMLSEIITNENEKFSNALIDEVINSQNINDLLKSKPEVILSDENNLRMEAMRHLLTWGGMPELLSLDDDERLKWLKSYIYTYLERDLSDLARIDDLEPFNKFEKLAALRSGNILVYSSLAKDAGISPSSARRYLEYLRLSYQTILLQPYSKNLTSSVVKSPKIYWADVGIMRALTGHWGDVGGSLFETFVVSELYKWIKTSSSETQIYYYRTRSGMEIDLLMQCKNGLIGIEIKNREKVTSSDCSNLLKLGSVLPSSEWLGGMVIYSGQKIFKLADKIWAVPAHRLL